MTGQICSHERDKTLNWFQFSEVPGTIHRAGKAADIHNGAQLKIDHFLAKAINRILRLFTPGQKATT